MRGMEDEHAGRDLHDVQGIWLFSEGVTMAVKDDMMVFIGSVIDKGGKKARELQLQAELTKTNSSIETAYGELGRTVMSGEGTNPNFLAVYGAQVNIIKDLEQRVRGIQAEIEQLSVIDTMSTSNTSTAAEMPAASVPVVACPTCGATVPLSAQYCPACSDNLASVKADYTWCPACGAYYDAEISFCMECGKRVESLPVAPLRALSAASEDDTAADASEPTTVCPACGNEVNPSDRFCGSCGAKLE